jgi:hypothetical protein
MIMNLFKNLFNGRQSNAPFNGPATVLDRPAAEPIKVDRDLFVELEVPAAAQVVKPSRLKELSGQDLTEVGRQAGYEYHDLEVGRQMAESIKAQLARALDEELDVFSFQVGELDLQLRRLAGEDTMLTTYRALEARQENLERYIMKLREQQLLIAGNTGYADLPLATFHSGFKQGYTAYLEANLLLNKYQG